MWVRLKFRMWANGVLYEQGVQEVPDGTSLPSSAVELDAPPPPPPAETLDEPDTFSAMLPKTAMEKKQ